MKHRSYRKIAAGILSGLMASSSFLSAQSSGTPIAATPEPLCNRVSQSAKDSNIGVSSTWSPVLQRTDQTKWGDDGSAIYADANGLLLWRTKDGTIRSIPNSEKAVPLVVSNQKAIVWNNAFNNNVDNPAGDGAGIDPIEVYLYRNSVAGSVSLDKIISDGSANNQRILGSNVFATAPITTTSQAYHIVTSDGTTNRIYRLTFNGDVQAVSSFGGAAAREFIRSLGHGSDGSLALQAGSFFWVDGVRRASTAGVWEQLANLTPTLGNRVLYTSTNRVVYEEIRAPEPKQIEGIRLEPVTVVTPGLPDKIVGRVTVNAGGHGMVSGDTVQIAGFDLGFVGGSNIPNPLILPNGVFQVTVIDANTFYYDIFPYKAGAGNNGSDDSDNYWDINSRTTYLSSRTNYGMVDARRNPYTGFFHKDGIDITPPGDYGRFLQISTQTIEGDIRWAYSLNKARNSISVYRLNNLGFVFAYEAALPVGQLLDESATVEKINPADGSAVITSDNIDQIIWVFNNGATPANNLLLIPDSRLAKGMFVSKEQLVTWHNAYDATEGSFIDGMLNKAQVRHYRQSAGAFVPVTVGTASFDYTDITPAIKGTFVMSTPIFSPPPAVMENGVAVPKWNFWTIEKPSQSSTTAVVRNYTITNNTENDSDGDGLSDNQEATYGTNPYLADTDEDGISDYDEVLPTGSTPTSNPLLADSDGDGVNDSTERFVLFSDRDTESDFMTPVVDLANPNGNYEGLVYSEEYGLVGRVKISVTGTNASKAFSGTYENIYGPTSQIKGIFNADGSLRTISSNSAFDAGSINMALQKQTARYHLHVAIDTGMAGTWHAKLRPLLAKYAPRRTKLTFEAKVVDGEPSPLGLAIATGTITNKSLVTFQIYLPNGSTATYAGSVLDGEVVALYARSKSASALMGYLKLDNRLNQINNLSGLTRYITSAHDQTRQLTGAYYVTPPVAALPLRTFKVGVQNAVFNWTEGILNNAYQVASWSPRGISGPKTSYDSTTATFVASTGLVKVAYARSDRDRNLNNTKTTAYAVVNQGASTVNGLYFGSGSQGGFNIMPNTSLLTTPVITPPTPPTPDPNVFVQGAVSSISSTSKELSASSAQYTIRVSGANNWRITIPTSSNWISTSIANDNGTVYSASPNLVGSGNATVTITVAANATNKRRVGSITIGNKTHTVTQAYR